MPNSLMRMASKHSSQISISNDDNFSCSNAFFFKKKFIGWSFSFLRSTVSVFHDQDGIQFEQVGLPSPRPSAAPQDGPESKRPKVDSVTVSDDVDLDVPLTVLARKP